MVGSISSFSQYVGDARRLRLSMRTNQRDAEYVNAGNSIIYFVDANVVGMFASPKAHVNYLSPFNNWLNERLLFGTSVLTAEFLFSGNLPGQKYPTLITLDHYDDLHGMVRAILKKGEQAAHRISLENTNVVGRRAAEISKLVENFKADKIDVDRLLAQLGQLLLNQ